MPERRAVGAEEEPMFDYYRFRFRTARGPGGDGPVELGDLRSVIVGGGIALVLACMVLTGTSFKGPASSWVVQAILLVVVLGFATLGCEYWPRTFLTGVLLLAFATVADGVYALLWAWDFRPPPRAVPVLSAVYGALVALAAARALWAIGRRPRPGAG